MSAHAEASPRRAVRAPRRWSPSRSSSRCSRARWPFIALQLVADVALAGYVYLLIQYKQRAQEQRSKVRYLGAAYREPGAVHERAVRVDAERVRPAPASSPSGRPRRTDAAAVRPWITRVRSPQPVRRRGTILEQKHAAREITLAASRRAIRSCASAIRAVHRREFREAAGADRRGRRVPRRGRERARRARRRALRRVPQRRQEGVRRGEPHARVRRRTTRCRPPPSSASRCSRTSTGWPRPRASCAARCSTACARDEGDEAERLLALMDDVYGLLVTDRLPRRAHRRAAAHDRRAARGARAHARRRDDRDRRRPAAGRDRRSRVVAGSHRVLISCASATRARPTSSLSTRSVAATSSAGEVAEDRARVVGERRLHAVRGSRPSAVRRPSSSSPRAVRSSTCCARVGEVRAVGDRGGEADRGRRCRRACSRRGASPTAAR